MWVLTKEIKNFISKNQKQTPLFIQQNNWSNQNILKFFVTPQMIRNFFKLRSFRGILSTKIQI